MSLAAVAEVKRTSLTTCRRCASCRRRLYSCAPHPPRRSCCRCTSAWRCFRSPPHAIVIIIHCSIKLLYITLKCDTQIDSHDVQGC